MIIDQDRWLTNKGIPILVYSSLKHNWIKNRRDITDNLKPYLNFYTIIISPTY